MTIENMTAYEESALLKQLNKMTEYLKKKFISMNLIDFYILFYLPNLKISINNNFLCTFVWFFLSCSFTKKFCQKLQLVLNEIKFHY